jgi:hypothetical protein
MMQDQVRCSTTVQRATSAHSAVDVQQCSSRLLLCCAVLASNLRLLQVLWHMQQCHVILEISVQFERIATEASKLARYSKKPTISSREIQTAVRPVRHS